MSPKELILFVYKDKPLSHSVSADWVAQWFVLYKTNNPVLGTLHGTLSASSQPLCLHEYS